MNDSQQCIMKQTMERVRTPLLSVDSGMLFGLTVSSQVSEVAQAAVTGAFWSEDQPRAQLSKFCFILSLPFVAHPAPVCAG